MSTSSEKKPEQEGNYWAPLLPHVRVTFIKPRVTFVRIVSRRSFKFVSMNHHSSFLSMVPYARHAPLSSDVYRHLLTVLTGNCQSELPETRHSQVPLLFFWARYGGDTTTRGLFHGQLFTHDFLTTPRQRMNYSGTVFKHRGDKYLRLKLIDTG